MDYLKLIQDGLKEFGVEDTITPDTKLSDLDIDSLDFVDLAVSLEDETGITFDDDELIEVKTIQNLLDLINKK